MGEMGNAFNGPTAHVLETHGWAHGCAARQQEKLLLVCKLFYSTWPVPEMVVVFPSGSEFGATVSTLAYALTPQSLNVTARVPAADAWATARRERRRRIGSE